jgi:serine/threonine protein kinase
MGSDNKHTSQAGQYYLMEKLAQGGMAEIFKGLSYDTHGLKKTVCIKKILPHIAKNPEFIESLIAEAKIAVKLVHGNIAQTYDLGKVADDYFMVMEFVDGRSLSQINRRCLRKKELFPIPHLLHFISETLGGLSYIHNRTDEHGTPLHIVHRDISPQNIMVSFSGTVKIIDFGIAKMTFRITSTDTGVLKGKFAYMSPEQAYGDSIDHRSDIFSTGVILHELLVGKRLFKAEDSRQTIRNVRKAHVEPPSLLRKDIEEELDRITMKSLTKDRRHRYEDAEHMREDILKLLHHRFPEYRLADAGTFVRELFDDELDQIPEESDAKTPHLIIERSSSALAGDEQFEVTGIVQAPLDMRQFMLLEEEEDDDDDDDGSTNKDHDQLISQQQDEDALTLDENDEEEKENSSNKKKNLNQENTEVQKSPWHFPWKKVAGIALTALSLLMIFGIAPSIQQFRTQQTAIPTETPHRKTQLIIQSIPPDATIFLDNTLMGNSSPITIPNLESKKPIHIRIIKEGYLPFHEDIELTPGEQRTLRARLKIAPPKPTRLEFTTKPSGATLFIDDHKTLHITPATLTDLASQQTYTIGVFLEGYRYWSTTVELKPGDNKSYEIQLERNFGKLIVDSAPQKALILIDGKPSGQTPYEQGQLIPGRIYTIEVWSQGYEKTVEQVKAEPGHTSKLFIVLDKEPTAAEREALQRKK